MDHDTAAFAVESCRWWRSMGAPLDPDATRLLVTADAGGSDGARLRLWKLVAATTTRTGLGVRSGLDTNGYQQGMKVGDADMATPVPPARHLPRRLEPHVPAPTAAPPV